MQKYNFSKAELTAKYKELKTIKSVAKFYGIPQSSMCFQFKNLNIAHKIRHSKKFKENFFSDNNEQSLYLAGFLAADGNVAKDSNRVTIGLSNKDYAFLLKIKEVLCLEGDVGFSVSRDSKRNNKYFDTETCSIRFSSAKTVSDLKRFNIVPNKTKTYTFPEWLVDHPMVHHFMRGYFDGDGSVYINKENQLCFNVVGNEGFLNVYKNILESNCDLNHNKVHSDRNIFKIKYCGNNVASRIFEFLYNDYSLCLNRKRNIFINGVSHG